VDHEDTYIMQVDMSYTSRHFTDQLNKVYQDNPDIDPYQI
jgi:hypothetical protein